MGFIKNFTASERIFVGVLMLALLVMGAANIGIEFESWHLRQWVSFLFYWAPLFLFIVAFSMRRTWWRIAAIVISAILTLLAIIPALVVTITIVLSGGEAMQEEISRQTFDKSDLVLYRTNCGAMCSYGLILQQEKHLLPGLRLTRWLGAWDPAKEAKIDVISSEQIHIEVAPYESKRLEPIHEDIYLPHTFLWRQSKE